HPAHPGRAVGEGHRADVTGERLSHQTGAGAVLQQPGIGGQRHCFGDGSGDPPGARDLRLVLVPVAGHCIEVVAAHGSAQLVCCWKCWIRRTAAEMSAALPAKESRTNRSPWAPSKSTPGVTATPSRSSNAAHHSTEDAYPPSWSPRPA